MLKEDNKDYDLDTDFLKDKESGFDANWSDKVAVEKAALVLSEGKEIRRFEDNDSTWWTHYTFEGKHYVGLCDFSDLWEVDLEEIEDY